MPVRVRYHEWSYPKVWDGLSDMTRLFVYGTLKRDSRNSILHLLDRDATFIGYARMRGLLFDLGMYPGVVASPDSDTWVHGEVYALRSPSDSLARLDTYEGCGINDPDTHEFERIAHEVELTSGETNVAWVYIYKGPTSGRPEIQSGNYLLRNIVGIESGNQIGAPNRD